MKRFWLVTKAMFLIHIRNRITLFWNMVFPLFMLVVYTVIFSSVEMGGFNYMNWLIPGVIVLNILAYGLMSSSAMLVSMRENGVLLRLHATPVPAAVLIGAYLIVNVLIALIQSGAILLTASLLFGYTLSLDGLLKAVPMILAAIVVSVAMGQIVSGVAVKAGVAVALGQILYFSQMFISDMVMPVENMPAWIQQAARYLPGYAITQLVRPPLMLGEWGAAAGSNLLLVGAYALVGAALAALLFRWTPRS